MTDPLLPQRPMRRYGYEEREDNLIRIVIPRFTDGFFGRIMKRIAVQTEDRLNLDALGTYVYRRCDGERTVEEIARGMKEELGEQAEPVEGRLRLFIQEMFKRNLITFVRNE
ncbi:MAG: PqqD family protein [Bacteroidota bacterium]